MQSLWDLKINYMHSNKHHHSCSEIQAKIQLLLDGELDRHTSATVQGIIQECDLCNQKYKSLLGLKKAVTSSVSYRETPNNLRDNIMNRIKDINSGRS